MQEEKRQAEAERKKLTYETQRRKEMFDKAYTIQPEIDGWNPYAATTPKKNLAKQMTM